MNVDKVNQFMMARPFNPFDIKMSDGRIYTVDHPEFVAMTRDRTTVIFSTEDNREVYLDIEHITTLEVANRSTRAA